jgi:6-phosphogluconolactonase
VSFSVEVLAGRRYADEAAARVALALPGEGSVVLTGGTTARPLYEALAGADIGWGGLEILFSDERCVPPNDAASNYAMASEALLEDVRPARVHRMRGEDDPEAAANTYHEAISVPVGRGLDLVLLGMGADCHVAGLFPASPALEERDRLCRAVDRPDGMRGLTLTPPALLAGRRVLLLVAGRGKAEAVRRAVAGDEPPASCPARLLAGHPDATFLVDDAAASAL